MSASGSVFVLHAEQWTDFPILIKLQTCHRNQHLENTSEKKYNKDIKWDGSEVCLYPEGT